MARLMGSVLLSGLSLLTNSGVQAAEKITYTRPSFSPFSSQMYDSLLGTDRFEKPVWNLHETLNLPKWLDLSVEQRTRYETMDGTFRAGSTGGDQHIALQTAVWLQAHLGGLRAGTEFLDARALGVDTGSVLNNTHANTADFLQAYLAWADQNLFNSGIGADVIAGRQTLNFGSRRLVARNAFRNTINNFTGGRLRLQDYDKWQLNVFVTTPVQRLPNAAGDILDDVHEFDEENPNTLFSGAFMEMYGLPYGFTGEAYLYHLDEGDDPHVPTRNRRYFTPGVRFYTRPVEDKFDFTWETAGQFGTVRASAAATDGRDLNHEAWLHHIRLGYTLATAWPINVAAMYDYAGGDDDPNDNRNGGFDTLFGARRWEYGPTGMYGAIPRSNISSPGFSVQVAPRPNLQATLIHRAVWLASANDVWSPAGLRDRDGASGTFIGQQTDLSVRWDVNSSLNLETGWAALFKGEFAQQAPSAPDPGDVNYFYVQSLLRF